MYWDILSYTMLSCFSTDKANVDLEKLRVLSAIVIPTQASLVIEW